MIREACVVDPTSVSLAREGILTATIDTQWHRFACLELKPSCIVGARLDALETGSWVQSYNMADAMPNG